MERVIDKGNRILTSEKIEEIDWIIFDTKKGAPFNLNVFLDPYIFYPELEPKERLIYDLLDPSKMEPYYRWQLCRRVINPLWTKGSGFEGHLLGLSEKEILRILKEQEEYLIRSAKERGFSHQFEQFIKNPKIPIRLELAINLREDFEVILARMRAIRIGLQNQYTENRNFQDRIYSVASPFDENGVFLDGNNLVIGFVGFDNQTNKGQSLFFGDIRHKFPHLAEIGRFGFPPFRILLHYLSANHQI